MQPYVIKRGDYLALLAHRFGFDADAVWNAPANDELRKLRSDPNILWPSDVLYVPARTDGGPAVHDVATGQQNSFVSDCPTVDVRVKFADARRRSAPVTIPELPRLGSLTTDGGGTITVTIPVTLEAFTVVFGDRAAFVCKVAHLDPVDTSSGVVQRLQNLGFLSPRAAVDAIAIEDVRSALGVFLATYAPHHDPSRPPRSHDDGEAPDAPPPMNDEGALEDDVAELLIQVHGG